MPNPKPGKAIPDPSSFGRGGRFGSDSMHVLLLCPGRPQREQTIVLFALLEVLFARLKCGQFAVRVHMYVYTRAHVCTHNILLCRGAEDY